MLCHSGWFKILGLRKCSCISLFGSPRVFIPLLVFAGGEMFTYEVEREVFLTVLLPFPLLDGSNGAQGSLQGSPALSHQEA